jgi:hypothetical protein
MMQRVLGLGLVLLASVGCRNPGDPLDQLQLFVAVEPGVVTAAAPVAVTVRIVNVSDRVAEVYPYGCPQLFEVRTLADELVGPEPMTCLAIGYPPMQLLPGEEWSLTYEWRGGGRGAAPWEAAMLPPGSYGIQAVLYPLCAGCSNRRSDVVSVVVE